MFALAVELAKREDELSRRASLKMKCDGAIALTDSVLGNLYSNCVTSYGSTKCAKRAKKMCTAAGKRYANALGCNVKACVLIRNGCACAFKGLCCFCIVSFRLLRAKLQITVLYTVVCLFIARMIDVLYCFLQPESD